MKTLVFKTHNNSNIQAKLLKKFELEHEIEITFHAEQEDQEPDFDESIMKSFQKTLDNDSSYQSYGVSHNWFCAHVYVNYKGYESDQYLGGCSYSSYKEFRQDAYYYQMISEAIDEINREIQSHNDGILKRWKLRNLRRSANELGFALVPKDLVLS